MTFTLLGPDPLEKQIRDVIERLQAGDLPPEIEVAPVDIKEEAGRRSPDGSVTPGGSQNEKAARQLADAMACMANTPGGGAVILGIADDGKHVGTELDPEWLRNRIYQITLSKLTISISQAELDGTGILILRTHEAIEPVRINNKIKWRVDANCVEVDAITWHAGKIQRTVDWSSLPSGHSMKDVRAGALEVARKYLRESNELDLADAEDVDLVSRLNLVDGNNALSNAGSLLLVATPEVGIDYIRRDHHGGDSISRVRTKGSLLEQVAEVDQASQLANRLVHLSKGFAHAQLRAIPPRAIREAIVNGIVHRDWNSPDPTTVEHVGDELVVSSPGGFIGGVTSANIITHPAVPRYRALAEAMAALNLAEREGIGVDRMVGDMLALGHPQPVISQIEGPYVRIALLGGDPDAAIVDFLSTVQPQNAPYSIDVLLLLQILTSTGWVDASKAAPVLQRPPGEAQTALGRLLNATIDGEPVIVEIGGSPADLGVAYQLGPAAGGRLSDRLAHLATPEGRRAQIVGWAQARGRVSSTEVSLFTKVSVPHAGTLLTRLEEDGLLAPSRPNRRGRGFYYQPIEPST